MRVILRRGTSQTVTLKGLRNTASGEYMNEATVTATILDSKGRVIPAYNSVQMTYVDGSNGWYEWEPLPVMLSKNVEYQLVFEAAQAGLYYRRVDQLSVIEAEA